MSWNPNLNQYPYPPVMTGGTGPSPYSAFPPLVSPNQYDWAANQLNSLNQMTQIINQQAENIRFLRDRLAAIDDLVRHVLTCHPEVVDAFKVTNMFKFEGDEK